MWPIYRGLRTVEVVKSIESRPARKPSHGFPESPGNPTLAYLSFGRTKDISITKTFQCRKQILLCYSKELGFAEAGARGSYRAAALLTQQ